jgi:hypothetical protein
VFEIFTLKEKAMHARVFLPYAMVFWAGICHSQVIETFSLNVATTEVKKPLEAKVVLAAKGATFCGIRISWGDGTSQSKRVNESSELQWVFTHQYLTPGAYTVTVEPDRIGVVPGCEGVKKTEVVSVLPEGGMASRGRFLGRLSNVGLCPTGWSLANPQPQGWGAGSYLCNAPATTALPETRQECPGDLTYFENAKKGVLGCRNL